MTSEQRAELARIGGGGSEVIDPAGTLICQHCHGLGVLESDEKIGNVLRILRREQAVRAKELAEEMLISPQYLTDLELGRRHWNAARARSYAH